jgi:predicted DCC family thiol-disulfide oxidoreductase YuxK
MPELTVLYDPHCGLCRRAQAWLISKPKYLELAFVPASSDEARSRYPQLDHELTLTDLTVISDRGAVYSGSKAWLMCLWALRDYREWALRLSSPELLPTAKRVISMISQNRYQLEGLSSAMSKGAK